MTSGMANSFPAMQAVMNTPSRSGRGCLDMPGLYSGLLLHPAAPEWDFDPWRLSPRTASRPGLHTGAWLDDDTAVQRFTGPDLRGCGAGGRSVPEEFPGLKLPCSAQAGLSALDRSIESFLAIEIPHFQARAKQGI